MFHIAQRWFRVLTGASERGSIPSPQRSNKTKKNNLSLFSLYAGFLGQYFPGRIVCCDCSYPNQEGSSPAVSLSTLSKGPCSEAAPATEMLVRTLLFSATPSCTGWVRMEQKPAATLPAEVPGVPDSRTLSTYPFPHYFIGSQQHGKVKAKDC